MPDQSGLALTFAGVSQPHVFVAAGATFPDQLPWPASKKAWHGRFFVRSDAIRLGVRSPEVWSPQ